MSFSIYYDEELNIIRGVLSGPVDNAVLRQYTIEMERFHTPGVLDRILSDYRDAEFSYSVVELFHLPDRHNDLLKSIGANIHSFKRALLLAKKNDEIGHFFENVANNRGQRVKVFFDEAEAIKWLINS